MPFQRTLDLTESQRQDLQHYRDHDPRPYVRERCAALLKIADGQSPHAVARHGLLKRGSGCGSVGGSCSAGGAAGSGVLMARWVDICARPTPWRRAA